MDMVLELILDIVLDGSFEMVTDRKLPVALRFAAGLILGFVYGGFAALGVMLLCSGVRDADVGDMICGIILLGTVAFFAVALVRKYRRRP